MKIHDVCTSDAGDFKLTAIAAGLVRTAALLPAEPVRAVSAHRDNSRYLFTRIIDKVGIMNAVIRKAILFLAAGLASRLCDKRLRTSGRPAPGLGTNDI